MGLDETSFVHLAGNRTDHATMAADVEHHQILDILSSRHYVDVAAWLDKQPKSWKQRIEHAARDMSATYAAVSSVVLPKAAQVVDPFHVISLANRALDAIGRRVQIEQLGHRGRRDDPLYRARRLLLMGEEKLSAEASDRLAFLLALGDPGAEVAIAYRVKERLRDFYRCSPMGDVGACELMGPLDLRLEGVTFVPIGRPLPRAKMIPRSVQRRFADHGPNSRARS